MQTRCRGPVSRLLVLFTFHSQPSPLTELICLVIRPHAPPFPAAVGPNGQKSPFPAGNPNIDYDAPPLATYEYERRLRDRRLVSFAA